MHTDATAAEQAKTDAQTAAQQAGAAAQKAGQALSDTVDAKEDALVAIGTAQETATQAVDTARDKALKQVEASTKAADTAASQAAASAGNADRSAQAAAGSLQALKNGIASGDFKGEPGTSPTVTVQDITGGHRIVITDATGTSSVDVLNGKQGDPGKPGDTGATPELTIGTVEEGDAPSATITGTVKKPILNLTLKSGAPGKDATVDATLTQSGQAADAKATGDALATKAVIDDTTVGTDAWSSKHIVDMLCPPLEETGNPVQCYPVENYPLGVTASWEPTQEGSGTPSPENIRPIKGRDSVRVERCGENLLPHIFDRIPDTVTKDGLTIVKTPKGTIHVSGEKTGTNWTDLFRIALAESERVEIPAGTYSMGSGVSLTTDKGNLHVPPFTTDTPRIITGAYAAVNTAGTYNKDYIPALVAGSEKPTKVEPYTGQTATLALPRTIYGGTVDAVTGVGKEVWKSITLDGVSEKFVNEYDDYWNLLPMNTPGISNQNIDYIVSSHFYHAFGGNITGFLFTTSSMMKRYFATPDELNAYIAAQYAAGTPVQIAYKLVTPEPFTATGALPIPALPGVNTIMTDADSVTVTGRADPIKRITDLEDAVASMTNT